MDNQEVGEDKISKKFIFFDFRDFSFHNYGQMFPDEWYKEEDTSLNCSPDTDAAIQDALEEIIRDLSGKQINASDIKLFDDNVNNFNNFTTWLNTHREIKEYETYIKKNIKNFASKKHKESDELCKKVFESLFTQANFQEFQNNINKCITAFLTKEKITDTDDTKKGKYLFKYLNVVLRAIPQPWNALASGAILKSLLCPEQKDENNQCHAFLRDDISKILDEDSEIPLEYREIVKYLQFYLEYALIINTPGEWKPPSNQNQKEPPQISMIVFPLIDNGFFRGHYYLLSLEKERIKAIWEKKDKLKQYREKCLFFTDSLRSAHETEMMDILFREKGESEVEEEREKDIYKRILKNLHYIQEISLGSLWMVNGNNLTQSYVTGYGRDFKGKPVNDETPGIYLYKGYEGYDAFFKVKNKGNNSKNSIKSEEETCAQEVNNLFRKLNDKEKFYRDYPKFEFFENKFNSIHFNTFSKGSYYNQSSLDIKWRLILPVVRGGDLKAIFFLYYRDPIVTHDDKFTLLTKVKDVNMQKEIFGLRARQIMKFFSAIEVYEERKNEIIKHGGKTARATIVSGSVSHNIGSHVLSSINDEVIKTRRPDVERLICYVQQRMDYIAGVTSDYPLGSEPTFFFFDLLKDFFEQGLLLDYITNDDGVPGEKIEFHVNYKNTPYVYKRARIVQLKNSEAMSFFGTEEKIKKEINIYKNNGCEIENESIEKYEFKKCNGGNVEDFLVRIPGGVIGRHAFYALLENFMRNGAKHGENKSEKYEVHIKVEEKEKYFEVELYDNWSKKDGLVNDMQRRLKKPIVQNDGSPTPGDWGIQEMKISADYLASPHITERVEEGIVSEEFFVYENPEDHKKYRIWPEGTDKLSYKFILQKSTLVVVADFNRQLEQEGDLSKGVVIEHVGYNEGLLKLVKKFSPQLLIIRPPENNDKLSSLLEYLKENHVSFPSRVLLCVDNETKIDELNKKISNTQGIPQRRYLAGNWSTPDSNDWEKFIINVYKEWIKRLGNLEKGNTLNLAIYFDRDKNHTAVKQWEELKNNLAKWGLREIVNILILHKEDVIKKSNFELNVGNKLIVFDNHNVIRAQTKDLESLIHYHGAGTESLFKGRNIFNTLQSFPQGFGGMYSLLLLLESACTKGLIIDERVASLLINPSEKVSGNKINTYYSGDYSEKRIQEAGLFVPLYLKIDSCYKCILKDEVFDITTPDTGNEKNVIEINDSGVVYIKDAKGISQEYFDFILIHKGALSMLSSKQIDGFIKSLCNFSPRVILTSGKGKRPEEKNDETLYISNGYLSPKTFGFLEYSVLRQFVVTDLSKYHLNRVVFSITKET